MANEKLERKTRLVGFLTRLRKDVRGNTLALMAAALVPMIALAGSGIDISRMYLVKSRLQQACDAGALAGRKQMGGGIWAQTTTPTPNTVATQFFAGNFKTGAYGTTGLTYAYSENSGDVTGTASVTVPMTMMKFFGMSDRTMSVTCDAQMQLPNTDVMFVLDNTGSMLEKANSSDPLDKIDTLKNAVKCFYEAVAQLKTNATCANPTSGSGVNSSSQIRFGFVPYTTNVNVGPLLPTSYFANTWYYQTKKSTGAKDSNGKMIWQFDRLPLDVSGLKNGTLWNSSVSLPLGSNGAAKSFAWDGCIEERQTVQSSSPPTFTINSSNQVIAPNGVKMNDLDIDMVPSQSDPNSLWGPALDGVTWTREDSNGNYTLSPVTGTSNSQGDDSSYYCPARATKLTAWAGASAFDNYVDSLQANGNTYHDIGLLWGARLMSPTGIFASENAVTPQGGQIQRHMIFMTDGDTVTSNLNYTAYGVAWYDRLETPSNRVPSDGQTDTGDLTQQVNARFAALCTATKNKGITLWVVSFGGNGIASTTKSRLQACATDANHYFDATSAASLNSAFQLIAAQITQLRLTK